MLFFYTRPGKSYAHSTKSHFPPSDSRFTGPTHFTFLPGKLARSKLFGYILHIFSARPPDSKGHFGLKISRIYGL